MQQLFIIYIFHLLTNYLLQIFGTSYFKVVRKIEFTPKQLSLQTKLKI